MEFLCFHLWSQPSEHTQFLYSSCLANSSAFCFKSGPLRGTLLALLSVNQRTKALSTSSKADFRFRLFDGWLMLGSDFKRPLRVVLLMPFFFANSDRVVFEGRVLNSFRIFSFSCWVNDLRVLILIWNSTWMNAMQCFVYFSNKTPAEQRDIFRPELFYNYISLRLKNKPMPYKNANKFEEKKTLIHCTPF